MESQEQNLKLGDNPGSRWLQVLSSHNAQVSCAIIGTICFHLTYLLLYYLLLTLILSFGFLSTSACAWSTVASLVPSTL